MVKAWGRVSVGESWGVTGPRLCGLQIPVDKKSAVTPELCAHYPTWLTHEITLSIFFNPSVCAHGCVGPRSSLRRDADESFRPQAKAFFLVSSTSPRGWKRAAIKVSLQILMWQKLSTYTDVENIFFVPWYHIRDHSLFLFLATLVRRSMLDRWIGITPFWLPFNQCFSFNQPDNIDWIRGPILDERSFSLFQNNFLFGPQNSSW